MNRDLSTPVWAIETYRSYWLKFDEAHAAAFDYYRHEFYNRRPEFPWGHHVAAFHQEVVYQVRAAFENEAEAGTVAFSNSNELFLVHLDDLTSVRCSAVHQGGFPNLNDTGNTRRFLGQRLLFTTGTVDDEATLLVGCALDPAWEAMPEVTVGYIANKSRVWAFGAQDAEMDLALELYRQTG